MTSNISGKSIGSAIKSLLNSEYKFMGGDRVQEMFIGDVLQLFKKYNRDAWNLEPGQTMWFAVCADEKQSYGKTLEKTRITPVILSVVHDEDRKTRENGYSHKELRRFKIARILREAFKQNVFFHRQMWQRCWVSAQERSARISESIRLRIRLYSHIVELYMILAGRLLIRR